MSRRLRALLILAIAEIGAAAFGLWWFDRRTSQMVDLLSIAYGTHGPVDYSTLIFPTPVLPLADRTPSKEPE